LIMLLSGVSAEELIEMRWAQFDAQSKSLRIADRAAREISLTEEICAVLSSVCARRSAKPDDRLFAPGTATGKEIEHLQAVIAYAAHDAGLENPAEITPALIRHTYIAYLARQGMRFSDLARIVGPLPAEAIAMYGALSPNGSRRALDAEERVMPALRSPATS
ncbi:MAG TPA: tyrosine-type recombinase/integrase, partial [Burkholderiales bacterium]|nr:tyrosine-type recombinase/integrase [Burkholderiales bacterium]